jgi:peptidoglycan/xylan/chitin deacetylase (PgdA/CDA1 family)
LKKLIAIALVLVLSVWICLGVAIVHSFRDDGGDGHSDADKTVSPDNSGKDKNDGGNDDQNETPNGEEEKDPWADLVLNIDTDDDGYPELNVDTNGDGKPDVNVDTDEDGIADVNIDRNCDGKADTVKQEGVKYIAITIDDGPFLNLQKKFVDELARYGGHATYFVVGNRVGKSEGEGLAYAVENGWEVAIHAWSHDYYFSSNCSEEKYVEEITKTAEVIEKYLPGYDIRLMRPPGGTITNARVAESEYAVVLWDVDSNDWQYTGRGESVKEQNIEEIVNNVVDNVRNGSIVLMHELYYNSFDAFCEILKRLHEEGYEFVTVSELLGDKYQTGKKYYSGR